MIFSSKPPSSIIDVILGIKAADCADYSSAKMSLNCIKMDLKWKLKDTLLLKAKTRFCLLDRIIGVRVS